ncbi:recombinase family protein [Kitasatospora purpeofusca]|uniref:recombinase family protein n=1 Tax=Kitasatospora purpeofusca TaxID=67352 RepID=UPI0022573583|nr:recombinase family protein [Kitasatospora purpeofusca]MCX4687284.1 recombinase family protein [Kitasatospora purpeofusca]
MSIWGGTVTGTLWYAAPYVRQSRKTANKSEASPEDQRIKTRACIENMPDTVLVGAGLYEDIGVSGYDPNAERKGFGRLMDDCRAGRINMIVVHYASRFSRQDTNLVLRQMLELFSLGVRIISVNEGEFKSDNLMDLMKIIMAAEANHNESKNKSIAVRGVFEAQRAAGGWVGGHAPYGFTAVQETVGKIVIQKLTPATEVPSEGPQISERDVVRLMWATIKAGKDKVVPRGKRNPASLAGVMSMLNDTERIPCRGAARGNAEARWSISTISRCLRDPRHAGYMAERVGRHGHVYRILRDEAGNPLVADYEATIPPDEWWDLQAWLETRGPGKGLYRHDSLLSALHNIHDEPILRCCDKCAKPMSSQNPSGTSTAVGTNYRCNFRDVGHKGTNTMSQKALDPYVALQIFHRIGASEMDADTADMLLAATKRFARTVEPAGDIRERRQMVTDRADAARALKEAKADYEGAMKAGAGPAVRSVILGAMTTAETRLAALDKSLAALDEADRPELPIAAWLHEDNEGNPIGEKSWWGKASLPERREFIAFFVEKISVGKLPEGVKPNRWHPYDPAIRVEITFVSEARDAERRKKALELAMAA